MGMGSFAPGSVISHAMTCHRWRLCRSLIINVTIVDDHELVITTKRCSQRKNRQWANYRKRGVLDIPQKGLSCNSLGGHRGISQERLIRKYDVACTDQVYRDLFFMKRMGKQQDEVDSGTKKNRLKVKEIIEADSARCPILWPSTCA